MEQKNEEVDSWLRALHSGFTHLAHTLSNIWVGQQFIISVPDAELGTVMNAGCGGTGIDLTCEKFLLNLMLSWGFSSLLTISFQ